MWRSVSFYTRYRPAFYAKNLLLANMAANMFGRHDLVQETVPIEVQKSSETPGEPSPERVHRDGTYLTMVMLCSSSNVGEGGETRIWDPKQPGTLSHPRCGWP